MTTDVRRRLDRELDTLAGLPLPGAGHTPDRLRRLAAAARTGDQSVVRLAEAHVDAVAIAAEAGHTLVPNAVYGVWASGGDLRLDPRSRRLTGTKPFCSGATVVDRALVTAGAPDGLALLDLAAASAHSTTARWETAACTDTATATLTWLDHLVPADAVVGVGGWYLDRVGFWQGACSPAATWAGAAAGVVDIAADAVDVRDAIAAAHLGAMVADRFGLLAALDHAGRTIDASPHDPLVARTTARSLRHVVERAATRVLDEFGQCLGPRPYVTDARTARLVADLHLLLRQQHGRSDDAELGRDQMERRGDDADSGR